MKIGLGLCLLTVLLAVAAGCGRAGVEAVRRQAAAVGAPAREQAFAGLLADPVWDEVAIEPLRYIRVHGQLRVSGGLPLEVCFEKGSEPLRLAFFRYGQAQYPAARWPDFLLWAVLQQELPPAAAPPAAPPAPAP